jgi:hypothetical protein
MGIFQQLTKADEASSVKNRQREKHDPTEEASNAHDLPATILCGDRV